MTTKEVKTIKGKKVLTKKEKAERKAKFEQSAYNQQVNTANKDLKIYLKKLKGVRTLMSAIVDQQVEDVKLSEQFKKVISVSKKDTKAGDLVWKHMQKHVREHTYKGKKVSTSTYTFLQYLYKYADSKEMHEMLKA